MGPTLVIELKNFKILSNIKLSDPINRWSPLWIRYTERIKDLILIRLRIQNRFFYIME